MIKKLRAKWTLWCAGICTKHFVPKNSFRGHDYCQQCADEYIENSKHHAAIAISILKGKK
jgi:hypothetical protein